jgi:ADP-heptose:LPS heptosyltransferase
MASEERYLLFCSTGLGDSLFCTPAIRFLRRQKPASRIIVVVKEKIRNLFETNPHIGHLISYRNNAASMWLARRAIRAQAPFRAIFLFHVGSEAVALIRRIAYDRLHGVQRLAGLPPDARLFPIDIQTKRQWEDFADMVALECKARNNDYDFELPLAPASVEFAEGFYRRFTDTAGPRIGLQLGGSHLGKCWPPDRYATVAAELIRRHGGLVFVNATTKETPLWRQFRAPLPGETASRCHLFPQSNINGLAALLSKLDLFISNDTGPLHVALSQNRPVIALKAHDDQTFPYTLPRATPVRRPIFVRTDVPTSGKAYQQSHRAMECIPVSAVLTEAEVVLRQLNL